MWGYEILVAAAFVPGQARKLVVVAAYIPPNYSHLKGSECLESISDIIMDIKKNIVILT